MYEVTFTIRLRHLAFHGERSFHPTPVVMIKLPVGRASIQSTHPTKMIAVHFDCLMLMLIVFNNPSWIGLKRKSIIIFAKDRPARAYKHQYSTFILQRWLRTMLLRMEVITAYSVGPPDLRWNIYPVLQIRQSYQR